jgi:hypothetical protein
MGVNEAARLMEAERKGNLTASSIGELISIPATLFLATHVWIQIVTKGGIAAGLASVNPFGWAALAAIGAFNAVHIKNIYDNWGKSKAMDISPLNPTAKAQSQQAPDQAKYAVRRPGDGDDPQAAGGAATGGVPYPPAPDHGIVAPATAQGASSQGMNQISGLNPSRQVGEVMNRLVNQKIITPENLKKAEAVAQIAKKYGIDEKAAQLWAKAKNAGLAAAGIGAGAGAGAAAVSSGPTGQSSSSLQPIGDDVNMNTNMDDPDRDTKGSIIDDTSAQREAKTFEPLPPVQPTATPTPPVQSSTPVEQGRFEPARTDTKVRKYTVVFMDEKGRPFTVDGGALALGYRQSIIKDMKVPEKKIGGQTYFFVDGMWTRGVTRNRRTVSDEVYRNGVDSGGLPNKKGLWDINKIKNTRYRVTGDEYNQIKSAPDNAYEEEDKKAISDRLEAQRRDRAQRGQQGAPQPSAPQSGAQHTDTKSYQPIINQGGRSASINQPGAVDNVTERRYLKDQRRYATPDEQKAITEKEQKDSGDYIPPELQGLVKRLTTPQPQRIETGDETLGKRGQTGLLRPEFIEGGANFVGEVNQDVTLNIIQGLGWQGFNNYQWESNQQFDNPLYRQELAQTGARFSGLLFGEEELHEQEEASAEVMTHLDPNINAYRYVPDSIQYAARNCFMAVQPYEGQAAKSDSDQAGFKTSIESNYEFHDVFLPSGFNFPSTGPLERFTEADGTQYPDSARLGGFELSLHDAEDFQNVNNWIATTST